MAICDQAKSGENRRLTVGAGSSKAESSIAPVPKHQEPEAFGPV
jgi:hypothetical protein